MHSNAESGWVRYLDEHDVAVLKQDTVNVRIGNLGVVRCGIGIPSPWRSGIL